MSLTLINLISEQTVPNLLPALAFEQLDRIVNVLSTESFESQRRRLEEAVHDGWQLLRRERALPAFETIILKSESPTVEETRRRVLKAMLDVEADYVVNYTGGTKNMSIGAYDAANITGSATIYCDTPEGFLDGHTGSMPPHLSMAELAPKLDVKLLLAAHGLFAKRDYHFTKASSAVAKFGEACFRLYQEQPALLRQFRAAWRKHCTEGKNRPNAADVARVETQPVPMADKPELAKVLDLAVRCEFLKRDGQELRVNFTTARVPVAKLKRLESVLTDLDGGIFEAVVFHKLGAGRYFSSFLRGVRPAGKTQTADFGESDFLAYSPETVSLTLISCKTTPPRLEHLESLLARKAKLGGRFAATLVCMEHEGAPHFATEQERGRLRSEKLQQLRVLGMQGAFADQLDEVFRVESAGSAQVGETGGSVRASVHGAESGNMASLP